MGCGHRHLTRIGALFTSVNTAIGVGFALLSLALPRWRDGMLVAESNRGLAYWFLTRRGFGAITLGRVVTSAIPITPELMMHESHHGRQYEILGPFYLPVYLWLHAQHGYANNPLEKEAAACAAAIADAAQH